MKLLALTLALGLSGAASAAETVRITIPADAETLGDEAFGPNPREIAAGTAVTWTNADDQPHTVTSFNGLFDSGPLDPGESFTYTFTQAEDYSYRCTLHGETGELKVKEEPEPGILGTPEPAN